MQLSSNATHPIEALVFEIISRRVASASIFNDITLKVVFSETMSEPSATKVASVDGSLNITISLNTLFLLQDRSTFITGVIPHELAHAASILESISTSTKIKPHGSEWARWMESFGGKSDGTGDTSEHFDSKAAVIFAGGVYCACECKDESFAKVFSIRSKTAINEIKRGEMICQVCSAPFTIKPPSDIPDSITHWVDVLRATYSAREAI